MTGTIAERRCVIVAGGVIENYEKIREYLRADDFFIFCDIGLRHQPRLKAAPDLIIGDFDSFDKSKIGFGCEVITLKPEKDDTDSFYSVKTAIGRGFSSFLLLGATGGRFDHTMANVSALHYIYSHGLDGMIADDFGRFFITDGKFEIERGECSYFSIVPLDGELCDITIDGAKYPLRHARAGIDYLYTVSNEVTAEKCVITLKNGRAVIFLAD